MNPMLVDILTLFPEMFPGPFSSSIISRAQRQKKVKIRIHDLRDFSSDPRGVDDRVYGGGVGMILKPEPIYKAVEKLKVSAKGGSASGGKSLKLKVGEKIILMGAGGKVFNQKVAQKFSKLDHLIIICGHYEGVDERVKDFIDEEISIGDYILTGGEIPAMVIVDAVTRLIPGVLKKEDATRFESFSPSHYPLAPKPYSLLEPPQYTRPSLFMGKKVPKVLLSGNHKEIEKWRWEQAIKRTKRNRPDLLGNFDVGNWKVEGGF